MKLEPRIHDSRNGLDYVLTDKWFFQLNANNAR